ncbi:SDR family NAD(P)-dependent oxidoreductase [Peribacillus butanolivorans]|uniref:SDR family NAD(P)-dependent oxidoreductase n=1 Tax=Peribacillus butanolivorans TaxID=421767 RepID=UPI003672DD5D
MLTGKVALVTGASRGIGRSVALRLAREGAAVGVNGTNPEKVAQVVSEIHTLGGQAIGICESIASVSSGEIIVPQLMDAFGQLDILVNNAGIVRDKKCINMSAAQWQDVIDVHLTGTFACTKAAINVMKERDQGGCIINMTSTAGLLGSVGQVNYSAAKAGILGMTWTLAEELKKDHIRVNAISPAALTDMTKSVIEYIQAKCTANNEVFPPFWQVGTADEVAHLIYLLTTIDDSELTGEVFGVNGSKISVWEKPKQRMLSNDQGLTADMLLAKWHAHRDTTTD